MLSLSPHLLKTYLLEVPQVLNDGHVSDGIKEPDTEAEEGEEERESGGQWHKHTDHRAIIYIVQEAFLMEQKNC